MDAKVEELVKKYISWLNRHPFTSSKTIHNSFKIGRNELCP